MSINNTAFTASNQTLTFDAPYNGTISGFDTAPNTGDALDLPGIAYDPVTTRAIFTDNQAATGGLLSIADSTHELDLRLLGPYAVGRYTGATNGSAGFQLSSDGHGGTLVTYLAGPADLTPARWIGDSNGNGDWNSAANWVKGTVPGSSDCAEIVRTGVFTITSEYCSTVGALDLTSSGATLSVSGSVFGLTSTTDASSNQGTILVSGGGSFDVTGAFTNGGTLDAQAGSSIIIDGAVANTGKLLADGGTIAINGAVSGTGTATIAGGRLEFNTDTSTGTIFNGSNGTLALFAPYHGTISGFDAGSATGDSLDLLGIGFNPSTTRAVFSEFSGGTAGQLIVGDSTRVQELTLLGQYAAGIYTPATNGSPGFQVASDGHDGTLVTYLAPPAS